MKAQDLRPDSEIFVKCIDAARSVLQITLENLYPTGYMRYAMEANFLYVAFAAAFLINVRRLFAFSHAYILIIPESFSVLDIYRC